MRKHTSEVNQVYQLSIHLFNRCFLLNCNSVLVINRKGLDKFFQATRRCTILSLIFPKLVQNSTNLLYTESFKVHGIEGD